MNKPESFERVLDTRETASPVEIDEILAWSYGVQAGLASKLDRARMESLRLLKMVESIKEGNLVWKGVQDTALGGIFLMESVTRAQDYQARQEKALRDHLAEVAPFEAEYSRRGGWSRYFVVQNDNGHIHSSMQCSTCNREGQLTRFGWLTGFSGVAAELLTDQVGPTACTVCFPWAETIRIEHLAEVKRQRASEKAVKDAEKIRVANEKGITTPEGEKLYAGRDNVSWDVCKTLRTAEIAATDALLELLLEIRTSTDPEWAYRYENRTTESIQIRIAAHAWCLLRSIAAKKGETFQEVFETHEKKAQAKLRKIDRDWAKDLRNPNRIK